MTNSKRKITVYFILPIVCALTFLFLDWKLPQFSSILFRAQYDLYFNTQRYFNSQRAYPNIDNRLVFFMIDDQTANRLGGLPLKRPYNLRMINSLRACGVDNIIWDIIFVNKGLSEESLGMAEAMQFIPNTIAFGVRMREDSSPENKKSINKKMMIERFTFDAWRYSSDTPVPEAEPNLMPAEIFLKTAKNAGHVARTSDSDGICRRIPLIVKSGDMLIPSLVLAAAMGILQVPHDDIIIEPSGSIILGASKFQSPIRIPIDQDGYFFMNYVPDWLEYFDVRRFVNQLESTEQFPQEMSEGLKGKSVLVGGVLSLTDDFVLTPARSPLPGAVVILNAINNILTRQFITIAKNRIIVLFLFVLPLLLSCIYLFKKPVISVIITVLLIALPIVASFWMFMNYGYYLPVGLPLLTLIITALLLALTEHFRQDRLAKHYSDILSRFVSPALMHELQKSVNQSVLPGVKRVELSVMFIDIAGFTSLTQHSEPEEISTLLDEIYQTTMQELFRYHGTLDKFIGDGLLAYFGAPKKIHEKEKQAARAALAIRARVDEANSVWNKKYGQKIQMRCGIATGYVTAGYFGGKKYATYTIIGKAVNLAARLETNAKVGQILIDSHTSNRINNDFTLEQLGPIELKGIAYPVNTWELVSEK